MNRCDWCLQDPLYIKYHDEEWGNPVYDSQKLFEFLLLEGMQAGLSWLTILKRREGIISAFHDFDPEKLAVLSDEQLFEILKDERIIRNKLKTFAVRKNAQAYLALSSHQSFSDYVWQFTKGKPIINHWQSLGQIPAQTTESQAMSRHLKKQGFTFVGPTICYAFMQATGMVNDHLLSCHKR